MKSSFKVLITFLAVFTVGVLISKKAGTVDNEISEDAQVPSTTLESKVVAPPIVRSKSVTRLNLPESKVVFLIGPIFQNAAAIAEQIKEKAKTSKDVYLLINSPGGSVTAGAMIVSAMEGSKARVHTICLQMCASMAFMIHQHGKTRLAVDRSILMAHPASGGVEGTVEQMNSRLSTLIRFVDKMNLNVANRSGTSLAEFKARSVSEYWIDAEDAKEVKLVDKIVDISTDAKPDLSTVITDRTKVLFNTKIDLLWE